MCCHGLVLYPQLALFPITIMLLEPFHICVNEIWHTSVFCQVVQMTILFIRSFLDWEPSLTFICIPWSMWYIHFQKKKNAYNWWIDSFPSEWFRLIKGGQLGWSWMSPCVLLFLDPYDGEQSWGQSTRWLQKNELKPLTLPYPCPEWDICDIPQEIPMS